MELPDLTTPEEITEYLDSKKSKKQLINQLSNLEEKFLMYRNKSIKLKHEICDLKEENLRLRERLKNSNTNK